MNNNRFERYVFFALSALSLTFASNSSTPNEPFNFYKAFVPAQESFAYTLNIQLPPNIKKIPMFCGYYKGEPLEFEQNFCIIHETFLSNHFSLFVTSPENCPQPKSDGNNVKYLERIAKKPCRLFNFTRTFTDELVSWKIDEEKVSSLPLRIPDDAIILLLNPEYIETIQESAEIAQEKSVGLTKLISLPKIVIKPTVAQEELNRISDTALLASLDLRAIHRKNLKTTKTERAGSITISMRT